MKMKEALEAFAQSVQRVTYEFENIPASTVAFLKKRLPVLPDETALKTSQDRLTEKNFFKSIDVKTANFRDISSQESLREAVEAMGLPAILKTRRFAMMARGRFFSKRLRMSRGLLTPSGRNRRFWNPSCHSSAKFPSLRRAMKRDRWFPTILRECA